MFSIQDSLMISSFFAFCPHLLFSLYSLNNRVKFFSLIVNQHFTDADCKTVSVKADFYAVLNSLFSTTVDYPDVSNSDFDPLPLVINLFFSCAFA